MVDNRTRKQETNKITFIGMLVNILLSIFKLIAGIFGGSAAMIADAAHSVSDLITDGVVIVGMHLGCRAPNKKYPYGHARFESLTSLIIAVILIGAALGIFVNGFKDVYKVLLLEHPLAKPGYIALIMAVVSIASKEALFRATLRVGKKIRSTAVISNAWHHRSDAFSSIATFFGIGGAIVLGDKWVVLDPACAMFVSIFILVMGFKILKVSLEEMLDKALPEDDVKKIIEILKSVEGVSYIAPLRTRRLSYRASIDLQITVDKNMPFSALYKKMSKIERKLRQEFGKETLISIHPVPLK